MFRIVLKFYSLGKPLGLFYINFLITGFEPHKNVHPMLCFNNYLLQKLFKCISYISKFMLDLIIYSKKTFQIILVEIVLEVKYIFS